VQWIFRTRAFKKPLGSSSSSSSPISELLMLPSSSSNEASESLPSGCGDSRRKGACGMLEEQKETPTGCVLHSSPATRCERFENSFRNGIPKPFACLWTCCEAPRCNRLARWRHIHHDRRGRPLSRFPEYQSWMLTRCSTVKREFIRRTARLCASTHGHQRANTRRLSIGLAWGGIPAATGVATPRSPSQNAMRCRGPPDPGGSRPHLFLPLLDLRHAR
jgi:hypothetical protein